MHLGRPTTPEERFSLKAAFRQLLKMAGGQEAASLITRGKHQTLNRYGNPGEDHIDCHAPIDVIADLEQDVGEPVVTRHLAEAAGYMLVKRTVAAVEADLLAHVSALAGESGEAVKAAVEAYSDGSKADEELENIVKQAGEAEHAAAAMRIAAQAELDARRSKFTPMKGRAA